MFLGFYQPDGFEEKRLINVILHNLDYKFYFELVISFGPLWLHSIFVEEHLFDRNIIYGSFKLTRYTRLFEMDGQIADILDYYRASKTEFEVKRLKR